jgi:hypothetical protein
MPLAFLPQKMCAALTRYVSAGAGKMEIALRHAASDAGHGKAAIAQQELASHVA